MNKHRQTTATATPTATPARKPRVAKAPRVVLLHKLDRIHNMLCALLAARYDSAGIGVVVEKARDLILEAGNGAAALPGDWRPAAAAKPLTPEALAKLEARTARDLARIAAAKAVASEVAVGDAGE